MFALHYLSYFFGAVFLFNSLPHLMNGLVGRNFPSLFSKPAGKALSTPRKNIYWAWINLSIGYSLVWKIGVFDFHETFHALSFGCGGFIMSLYLSNYFEKLMPSLGD